MCHLRSVPLRKITYRSKPTFRPQATIGFVGLRCLNTLQQKCCGNDVNIKQSGWRKRGCSKTKFATTPFFDNVALSQQIKTSLIGSLPAYLQTHAYTQRAACLPLTSFPCFDNLVIISTIRASAIKKHKFKTKGNILLSCDNLPAIQPTGMLISTITDVVKLFILARSSYCTGHGTKYKSINHKLALPYRII